MAWFQNVSNAIYDALCSTFGVDPSDSSSLNRFVPAFTNGITTPQYNIDDNVCFYSVAEQQGTGMDYTEVKNGTNEVIITKTIPVTVLLAFYGPNADDDAEYFWSNFMIDTGKGSPRSLLRQQNIVPVGKAPQRPVALPEIEGSLWRRRCDVRVNLSYLDVQRKVVQTITDAPEVNIVAE